MKKIMRKSRKGVTLVEIIIVIVIMAIIGAVAFFAGSSGMRSGKQAVAQSDLRTFNTMATQMLYENVDLAAQTALTAGEGEKIFNKYLGEESVFTSAESAKLDPWGNPYQVLFSTADRSTGKSEFYVMVYSGGDNGTATTASLEEDDCGAIIALSDGAVKSEVFGFKDSAYSHAGHDISKIIVNTGRYAS